VVECEDSELEELFVAEAAGLPLHGFDLVVGALRESYTRDKQLRDFHDVFGREPLSDDELDAFVEEFTLEMYNEGYDEIP
jgi:hypothetical protein